MSTDTTTIAEPVETTTPGDLTLPQVAAKRAWQTALQGLLVDVGVAVAVLILSSLDEITTKAAAITFAIALGKTVVATACSWVIRRYRDQSGFEQPRRATDS